MIMKTTACHPLCDTSIRPPKLLVIVLELRHVYHSKGKSFLILSNSLSALQAVQSMKYEHRILMNFPSVAIRRKSSLFLSEFQAQLAIRDNSAAEFALNGDNADK